MSCSIVTVSLEYLQWYTWYVVSDELDKLRLFFLLVHFCFFVFWLLSVQFFDFVEVHSPNTFSSKIHTQSFPLSKFSTGHTILGLSSSTIPCLVLYSERVKESSTTAQNGFQSDSSNDSNDDGSQAIIPHAEFSLSTRHDRPTPTDIWSPIDGISQSFV